MNNLIRKKVILCLLDSDPKSADAIANEIDESLATVDDQLTGLVSDSICEEIKQVEGCQYAIRKDVGAFAQLVKDFLLNPGEHEQETMQYVTSEYYLTRIDYELVNYVISRFYLDSVFQTNEDKETIRRILRVSPSSLIFALHGDTARFRQFWSSQDQIDTSEEVLDYYTQMHRQQHLALLSDMLMLDMRIPTYAIFYAKLGLRVARLSTEVSLASLEGKYIEIKTSTNLGLGREVTELSTGQLVVHGNPIDTCYDGIAFLHLGEFQTALEYLDEAFNTVQGPDQKAKILNHKGFAFLKFKQYQKAIECFEEGIALDSGGDLLQLRVNKQVAEEYLAIATDADNLTEPTRIRFIQGQPVPFEETLFYEFKEIRGGNLVDRIEDNSDEYAVAFLNRQGGRIFWGIRDKDRITIGVELDERRRDEIRAKVSNKLGAIRPPISPEYWQLEFHNVYDLQGEMVEDLWVVELVVPPPQERNVFYTGGGSLYVKTDGGKKKLIGPEVTEFIRNFLQSETETD